VGSEGENMSYDYNPYADLQNSPPPEDCEIFQPEPEPAKPIFGPPLPKYEKARDYLDHLRERFPGFSLDPPEPPSVVPVCSSTPTVASTPVSSALPGRRKKKTVDGTITDDQREKARRIIRETLPSENAELSVNEEEYRNQIIFPLVSRLKSEVAVNRETIRIYLAEFYDMLATVHKEGPAKTFELYHSEALKVLKSIRSGAKGSVLESSRNVAKRRIKTNDYSDVATDFLKGRSPQIADLVTFLEELQLSSLVDFAEKGGNGLFYCGFRSMADFLGMPNAETARRLTYLLRDKTDYELEDCGFLREIKRGENRKATVWTLPHASSLFYERTVYRSWFDTPLVSTYAALSPTERRTLTLGLAFQDLARQSREQRNAKDAASYSVFFGGKISPRIKEQPGWKTLETVRQKIEESLRVEIGWQVFRWQRFLKWYYGVLEQRNEKKGKTNYPYIGQLAEESFLDQGRDFLTDTDNLNPTAIRPPLFFRQLYWETLPEDILNLLDMPKPPVDFFE
jgi:hypothetical protein